MSENTPLQEPTPDFGRNIEFESRQQIDEHGDRNPSGLGKLQNEERAEQAKAKQPQQAYGNFEGAAPPPPGFNPGGTPTQAPLPENTDPPEYLGASAYPSQPIDEAPQPEEGQSVAAAVREQANEATDSEEGDGIVETPAGEVAPSFPTQAYGGGEPEAASTVASDADSFAADAPNAGQDVSFNDAESGSDADADYAADNEANK